jgi:hypothetical protein
MIVTIIRLAADIEARTASICVGEARLTGRLGEGVELSRARRH